MDTTHTVTISITDREVAELHRLALQAKCIVLENLLRQIEIKSALTSHMRVGGARIDR